jgi:hypothetical protein
MNDERTYYNIVIPEVPHVMLYKIVKNLTPNQCA